MEINRKDLDKAIVVKGLIHKMDIIEIDEVNAISERVVKNQPFIMSMLIGYKYDVKGAQLDDIMKMLFVIYLFFEKYSKSINSRQIDSIQFESILTRNKHFLKYFSEEKTNQGQLELNKQYLSNLRAKSLFTGILVMSKTLVNFKQINADSKGIILIGMKTLIDCLELTLLVE